MAPATQKLTDNNTAPTMGWIPQQQSDQSTAPMPAPPTFRQPLPQFAQTAANLSSASNHVMPPVNQQVFMTSYVIFD